jgi:hypothetical protein
VQKNIALFIDGTRNEYLDEGNPKRSNVPKLSDAVVNDGVKQIVKYMPGVGTRVGTYFVGGASGFGTARRIRTAYRFLSETYSLGDKLYLFGFSRGAFAARSLSGFVEAVGLLLRKHLNHVEQAYDLYVRGSDRDQSPLHEFLQDMTGSGAPVPDVSTLPIYFIGLWDTVAALGTPGRTENLTARFIKHHKTELPTNVTHARHALALHELRRDFKPLLWTGCNPLSSGQSLEQVWFPGVHSDVGGGYGGYPHETAELSDVALDWIASEAQAKGLSLRQQPRPGRNATTAVRSPLHNSWRREFKLVTPTPRRALIDHSGLDARTRKSIYIHQVVCLRLLESGTQSYETFPKKVANRWHEIDEIGLQLHLELSFEDLKFPIAMPRPSNSVVLSVENDTNKNKWWTRVRVIDVANSRRLVDEFVKRPVQEQCEEFKKSLCLLILCGGNKCLEEFQNKVVEEAMLGRNSAMTAELAELHAVLQPRAQSLRYVTSEVENCVAMLPPQWSSAVRNVAELQEKSCWSFLSLVIDRIGGRLCRDILVPHPLKLPG